LSQAAKQGMGMAAEMGKATAEGPGAGTVDPAEVERFARIASTWWEPEGEFRPLHKLNPVRLGFIRDRLAARFGRDIRQKRPFAGRRLLDIGCGGGLVSEPLARLGFSVTGIDAGEAMLEVARGHAAESGVAVEYRQATAEDLAAGGEQWDAVLALEVVEHVASPELFLAAAARLVKPGGAFIAATINRTPKAFLFAILGAEYVLQWLPRGTHHWNKFLRPSEIARGLRPHGLTVQEVCGLTYSPIADRWSLGRDLDVNYLLLAVKPPEAA
jgi:2-polyprenyl-6-hydroxyphenyl methylase/3-demethylubiquinone-9 3-methyltransferase